MDDVIIVVENKEKAREINNLVSSFVRQELNLVCNEDKTKIFPINQGVNAIGFKIHATHRLLRNDSKKTIKRKAKKIRYLLIDGQMTKEKAEQIFNSWLGHAKHGNSRNFIQQLLERNDYIYMDNKGALRVDMSKL